MTTSDTTSHAQEDAACPACRAIDVEDGRADGKLFTPPETDTKDERSIVASLARAQDHVADRITTFAGSLNFV